MLESYQAYADYHDVRRCEEIVAAVAAAVGTTADVARRPDDRPDAAVAAG